MLSGNFRWLASALKSPEISFPGVEIFRNEDRQHDLTYLTNAVYFGIIQSLILLCR